LIKADFKPERIRKCNPKSLKKKKKKKKEKEKEERNLAAD